MPCYSNKMMQILEAIREQQENRQNEYARTSGESL